MASSRQSEDDYGDKLRCWEDLPSDMLQLICYKLLNDKSVYHTLELQKLGSVCSSWRSSIIPLQSCICVHFPLKVPPPPLSMCLNIAATLSQSDILLFTPPGDISNNGWIVKVGQRPQQNAWCLKNPFSVSRVAFEHPKLFKGSVNILDNTVKHIIRSYLLEYATVSGRKPRFAKVVIIWSEEADDFTALALFEEGKLGLWRPGEAGWRSFVGDHQKACLSDIIAFRGKFYATTKEAKLVMIDPVTYEVHSVITDKLASEGLLPVSSHLVESNGHLYLVHIGVARDNRLADALRLYEVRSPRVWQDILERPDKVRVYMLENKIEMNGNQICSLKFADNLEDRVFFTSKYMSFSLTAKDLGWSKGNCVLLPRNINEHSTVRFSSAAVKAIVFCQRHFANCLSVFTLEDLTMASGSTLAGQFTNIFWPPPEWLLQEC